jgi:PEP-CTERM motif-containing protein
MRRAILEAALAACLICVGSTARAADFIFMFGSDLSDPDVDPSLAVSGNVTGRIIGLADDGTSSAQSVFIDTYSPDGTVVPVDVMLWLWPSENENSFVVENGEIVSALFRRSTSGAPSLDQLWINVEIFSSGTNFASLGSNNSSAVWNNQGLDGITFTRIETLVPEPATWAMMLLGFGAVGLAFRRRREGSPGLA